MSKPVHGRLWKRSGHRAGSSYLAGILEDGSRVVVWNREGRLKGEHWAEIEVFPNCDPARPAIEWGGAPSSEAGSDG